MKVLLSDISIFSLNNFDLFMVGILGASVVFGLIRGLIKSFIALTGWIVSMGIGMKFYFLLEPLVSKYVTLSVMAAVIAGITLFLISAIVIAIINNIFYIALDSISGGFLDRSLGLLLGFIRGCLLVSFIFYILLMILPQLHAIDKEKSGKSLALSSTHIPSWAKNSESILLLNRGAALIDEVMPIDFERKLKKALSTGEPVENYEEESEHHKSIQHDDDTTKQSDMTKGSVSKILNFLPKEVLDNISQDDLVLLQDKSASPKEKVKILENISNEYQQYIDEEDIEELSRDELNKRDSKYYNHMSIIENQIIEYSNQATR